MLIWQQCLYETKKNKRHEPIIEIYNYNYHNINWQNPLMYGVCEIYILRGVGRNFTRGGKLCGALCTAKFSGPRPFWGVATPFLPFWLLFHPFGFTIFCPFGFTLLLKNLSRVWADIARVYTIHEYIHEKVFKK